MSCTGCEARDRTIADLTEELAAWKDYGPREMVTEGALARREAWRRVLGLSNSEAVLLLTLVDRAGVVLSRDALLDRHLANRVVSRSEEPEAKIIDVYLCRLRIKLRAHGVTGAIRNRYGVGYFIEVEAAERLRAMVGEVAA